MKDYCIVFLTCTWEEARYIYQCNQRNIEGVAETNETSTLTRSVTIQYTCQIFRLVGNDTYRLTIETGKTNDDVLCIILLNFKEFAIIYDSTNYFIHIVRLVRAVRNNFVQRVFQTVDWICTIQIRSFFQIVLWNVAQQLADKCQTFFFCLSGKVSNTTLG